MSVSSLFTNVYDYCRKHKGQCVAVIGALVLAFGFYATQYTYHIDMLVDEYYNGTVLIGAGRFSAPIINYLTNWMQFAPFWHTAVMAIILFFGGLVFGLLFKEISNGKITDTAVFAFWIIFSTYPIICYQITYPILSVVLPYILVGVSLWLLLPIIRNEKLQLARLIVAILLLVISVDMYESHATVFLTAFFAALFIKYFFDQKRLKSTEIIFTCIKVCVILLVAIILDWLISKGICFVFCDTFDFWYKTNTSVDWLNYDIITTFKWLIRELIAQYLIAGVSNYSIFMFDVAVVLGLAVSMIVSIKRRNLWFAVLYLGMIISSMALAIILGTAPEYRMAQAIPVVVSFFLMLALSVFSHKKMIKNLALGFLCILVLNQTLCINRFTVVNYERHQYENNILINIADDLREYSIEKKPVLFINDAMDELPDFDSTPLAFNNPISQIYKRAMFSFFDFVIPKTTFKRLDARFGNRVEYDLLSSEQIAKLFNEDYKNVVYTPFNTRTYGSEFVPEIYAAFDRLGCELIIAEEVTIKDFRTYCERYRHIPSYPDDGYIMEYEDLIVVKIY